MTAGEILEELNDIGEHERLEAKSLVTDNIRSLMETVCSFSNEPGLGGGVIILGVREEERPDGSKGYVVDGIDDLDHAQLDISTQCKGVFNHPVTPRLRPDRINRKKVLIIEVDEADAGSKPIYFRSKGIPSGAYRRVGSADLACTDEDIRCFYELQSGGYDGTSVKGARVADADPLAIRRYRELRRKVNPEAEELSYSDAELLEALCCTSDDDPTLLNVAGVLLFGTQKMLRRHLPMARVDYIRVPTMEWVEDPDESFETVDMHGSLLLLVSRAVNLVQDDLLKGFVAPKDGVQAGSRMLPTEVLREAIVNALMHSSYREGSPIQIIRYPNRIEIRNAGYSLKPPEKLLTPGSVPRNKILAPVFHDTNLAETKGSGFKRMERALQRVGLALPTAESDRVGNTFSLILLLHHLLNEDDLNWLAAFKGFRLTDKQKLGLVFVRQIGAIDNFSYRRQTGVETLKACHDLQHLRDLGLLDQRGQGTRTYYRPGAEFLARTGGGLQVSGGGLQVSGGGLQVSGGGLQVSGAIDRLLDEQEIRVRVERFKDNEMVRAIMGNVTRRMRKDIMRDVIWRLCSIRPLMRQELALLLGKNMNYIWGVLKGMKDDDLLVCSYPEMPNHPAQSYRATGPRRS